MKRIKQVLPSKINNNHEGNLMKKRGAIFFTIDAMIAGIIFALTVIVLLSLYVNQPVVEDTMDATQNYISYITETQMYQFRSSYKFIYDDPNESQTQFPIYQKIAWLVANGSMDNSKSFIDNFTKLVLPDQFGIQYKIDNLIIYERPSSQEIKTNLSFRLMTYFPADNTTYGPNITQVSIWS